MTTSKRIWIVSGILLLLTAATAAYAAVDLAYFTGDWEGDSVQLEWGTGTETNHAAFFIWRSTENLPISGGQIDTSNAEQLNSSPIQNPNGVCGSAGYDYEFTDTTVSDSVDSYYYYLASIPCGSGPSEFEGDQDGGSGGLQVDNPSAPVRTPTRTATTQAATATATGQAAATPTATQQAQGQASPTNTPQPGATTANPSATSAPSNTPQPGTTNTPTTAARANTPTSTSTARPTNEAQTQATNRTTPLPTATSAVIQEGGADTDAGSTDESANEEGSEAAPIAEDAPVSVDEDTSIGEEAVVLSADDGEGASAESGDRGAAAMSGQPAAATPTLASLLTQSGEVTGQELVAGESQTDNFDRVIQGVIGLILLAVVALVGFMGWTYVRR